MVKSPRARGLASAVGLVVLGVVLGYPQRASSKGQWCNDKYEGRRIELTLESSSVDGVAVEARPAPGLHFRTESFATTGEYHAQVADMQGGSRAVHVRRQP